MIEPIISYSIKCDRCGKIFFDDYRNCAFDSEFAAEQEACRQGWYSIIDNHYCTDCYVDGLIRDPIPDYVRKLKIFMNTISKSYPREFVEENDFFAIRGYTKGGKELDACDKEFIKSFAGDKLIGIEMIDKGSSNAEFIIKLKKE